MANLNKVLLIGNLTRDPELRYTQSGLAVCDVGLAVNRKFQTQGGETRDETCFLNITIFGKRGEAFSRYFSKGKPAFIEGRLKLDEWEDKQSGQKRSRITVVAENWEFVGPASQGSGGSGRSGGSRGGGQEESHEGGVQEEVSLDDTPF